MKKVVLILLAILMVMCLTLGIAACKSDCDKGNHPWDEGKVTTPATCTTEGVKTYKCTQCDETKTEPIDKIAHSPIDASVAATCTTAGVANATKCSVCGTSVAAGTTIPAKGHTVTTWTVCEDDDTKHEGTCTVDGCGTKVTGEHEPNEAGTECTLCHKTLGGGVEPHEHDYTDAKWTVCEDDKTKHQATCTVAGCGHVETASHTPVTVTGKPATCTEAGKENGSKCSTCNYVIKENTVIPAKGHDYEDQLWRVSSDNKHYQICKNGCNVRNEHAIVLGDWTLVGDMHQQKCTVEGCGAAPASHEPNLGEWVTTDETNHYKECETCHLHAEEGAHNQSKCVKLNATQHAVYCSTCNKKYANANHTWDEGVETKAPTCTATGVKTFTCTACTETYTEDIEPIAHPYEYVNDDTNRVGTCPACGKVVTIAHEYAWQSNADEHWRQCKNCKHINESTRGGHDYEGVFVCKDCERTPKDVIVALYDGEGYHPYTTLVDAIAAVNTSDPVTICLGQDLSGAGIAIPANSNITLRLFDNTYTITSAANGTQGIVIGKDASVTIVGSKSITVAENSGVTTLIANYGNLTIESITIDGTNLTAASEGRNSTIVYYYGTSTLEGVTINARTPADAAISVWYGSDDSYMDGVSVYVKPISELNGVIEYGSAVVNPDWSKAVLKLRCPHDHSVKLTSAANCDDVHVWYVDVNDDTIENRLAHRQDDELSCDEANGKHYYDCSRCHAHLEEEDCNKVAIGEAKDSTCTATGMTAGLWCPVCENVYEEQATIAKLPHSYSQAWTAVDALQHAHKCANCPALSGTTNHTYAANHCEACGRDITETEILTALDNLGSGVYLCGNTSTFTLTGVITIVNYSYTETNGVTVTMKVGGTNGTEIYCFKMRGSDVEALQNLQVGDTITVLGSIVNYQGTKLEFDQGCTLEEVTYANVTITWTKADNVTVDGMVNEVERYTDVEFSVTHNDNDTVVVKVNGTDITADENGVYSFKAEVATTVTIEVYGVNDTRPHTKIDAIENIVVNNSGEGRITATSYANASESSFVCNGITVAHKKVITANKDSGSNFQMSDKNDNGKNAYLQLTVPSGYFMKAVIDCSALATINDSINVVGINADGGTTTLTVNTTTGEIIITNAADLQIKSIKITMKADKAINITKITVDYGEISRCSNTTSFGHSVAQPHSCTENGTIEYWYCTVCDAKFSDELCNNRITNVVDPAGHSIVAVSATDPVCSTGTDGIIACYQCSVCKEYFADEQATTPLTVEQVIRPYNHTLTIKHDKVFPTATTSGKEEYWECSVCHAYFEDAQGVTKITDDINGWGIIDPVACETHSYKMVINAESHSMKCTVCGDLDVLNDDGDTTCTGTITYEKDSETHIASCEVCGNMGEAEDHTYGDVYTYVEEGYHARYCTACDYDDLYECEIENGACKDCHRIVGEKPGDEEHVAEVAFKTIYKDSADGTVITEVTLDKFVLTFEKGLATKYYSSDGVRFYANNELTITAPSGATITKIVFTSGTKLQSTSTSGFDYNTQTWSGTSSKVVFVNSNTSQAKFSVITITYTLSEDCYHDGEALEHYAESTANDCEVAYCSADCYHCTICGMNFADEACTQKLDDVEIREASEHDYGELHAAVPVTCVALGNIAYYQCSVCSQYFDEDKEKVTDVTIAVDPTAHALEWKLNADLSHYQQCTTEGCTHATDVCNGSDDPEVFVITSNNNGTHSIECYECGAEFENLDCTYDDDNTCTVCGHQKSNDPVITTITHTQTITFVKATDNQGAATNDLNYNEKANIIISCSNTNASNGTGGAKLGTGSKSGTLAFTITKVIVGGKEYTVESITSITLTLVEYDSNVTLTVKAGDKELKTGLGAGTHAIDNLELAGDTKLSFTTSNKRIHIESISLDLVLKPVE